MTPPVLAAGPWRARVIDAETKRPLPGVVVVAVWQSYLASGNNTIPGWLGYAASEETVTDDDGRFTIAVKNFSSMRGALLDEPEFFLFKPGYGQWRFQEEEQWSKLDARERASRYQEAGKQFEHEGATIEIPPLETRDARVHFYQSYVHNLPAPPDQLPHWKSADDLERANLGL